MSGLDHSLIYQARKFINGENNHRVGTWIFCYETSALDSPRRERFEALLRDFVATKNMTLGIQMQAKLAVERGIELRRESTALEEEITNSGFQGPMGMRNPSESKRTHNRATLR